MANQVAERMRKALEQSGKTQRAVARALKVSQPTVSQWLQGKRNPGNRALSRFADVVGVDPGYLLTGKGTAPAPDLSGARSAYRRDLRWDFRKEPPDGARQFGNPGIFAFDANISSFVREVGQNALDAAVEPAVSLTFRLVRLEGNDMARWLEAIKWKDLRENISASAESGQQVGEALGHGLAMIDAGEIVLLGITDEGTCGLNGEEVGEGNFAALCRNMLDSSKPTGTAGGSFGLGKGVLWRMSSLSTVFFLSNLSKGVDGLAEGRFIGRSELVWHRVGTESFDGPGWFGIPAADQHGRVVSLWENRAIAEDLSMRSPNGPGTSILVSGFHDPSADETLSPAQLASRIEEAAAEHFWPAMATGRLQVGVEVMDGKKLVRQAKVDTGSLEPALSDALAKHQRDDITDHLVDPGDVVRIPVELEIPKRTAEETHPRVRHQATVLIRKADPDDESRSMGRAFFFRGTGMVIKALDLRQIRVGAHPFHVAVLCGNAAGSDVDADRAEVFLRAAEPPSHNDWQVTPKLNREYEKGGGARIWRFQEAVRSAVREVLSPEEEDSPDGPRDLAELFRLSEPTPAPERAPRLILDAASVVDGHWEIEATVRVKPTSDRIIGRPILVFNGESGLGKRVRWTKLEGISNCVAKDDQIAIAAGKRTARFRGESDRKSHPIPAQHASISVDFRIMRVGGEG